MNPANIRFDLNDGLSLLDVAASKSGDLILKVLDVQGRIAKTFIEKVEQGAQQLCFNMTDLNDGNYVLNAFWGGTFIQAIRFIKQ